MNLLTQNKKLKDTSKKLGVKVFNFSIPAYKSKTGKTVCPFADACIKYCYAQKGNYTRFPKTEQLMEQKLEISKTKNFIPLMVAEATKKKVDFIRIHDSGDFYSPKYLAKWLSIAKQLPNVKFYAYTKSHDLFRSISIPENFDIIFSEGSKLDGKLNKETERHASIFATENELKKAGYTNASKVDLYATKFFTSNNKIGLVYH
jgi:DNA repair photolyase